MNVAQLKDRIIRSTGGKYDDSFHILDLLNEGLNTLTNDALLEGVAAISVVSGNANYALPADYKSPRALVEGTLDNPDTLYPLVAIDEVKFGYALWNGEIVLKPTPGESKSLNLYYYKWATPLADDEDEPEIDSHYHSALASYAIAMIMSLPDMGFPKHAIDRHFAVFDEARANFKADIAKGKRQSRVRLVETWR